MSNKQWRDWVSPDIDYIKVCPDVPVAPDYPCRDPLLLDLLERQNAPQAAARSHRSDSRPSVRGADGGLGHDTPSTSCYLTETMIWTATNVVQARSECVDVLNADEHAVAGAVVDELGAGLIGVDRPIPTVI